MSSLSVGRSFISKTKITDPYALNLSLKVHSQHDILCAAHDTNKPQINGALKQNGSTGDMIFRIPRLIEHISSIMTLEVSSSVINHTANDALLTCYPQEGDLVLTGTPSGVGPISAGDQIECALADAAGKELATLDFTAITRQGGYHFKAD